MDDLCLRNNDTSKWFLMMFQSVYEWLREKEKVEGREGLKYENLARQLAWLLVLGYGIILHHLALCNPTITRIVED